MTKLSILAGIAGATLFASGAAAQYVPGSEIVGQTVQVETNGVVNNVTFEPGGTARIATPSGNVVPAELDRQCRTAVRRAPALRASTSRTTSRSRPASR